MRRISSTFILSIFLLGISIPFNNFSYPDASLFTPKNHTFGQDLTTSIAAAGLNPLIIPATSPLFTVSGQCNSGSYKQNTIDWTIYDLDNNVVADSASAGKDFKSSCKNGAFSVNVKVPCPGLSNTGPDCLGLTKNYNLKLHVVGLNAYSKPANAGSFSQIIAIKPGE